MIKKILIIVLLLTQTSYASFITYGTTYAPTGQVTSTNLNGNFSNVSNIVNGGLDNTNANTTSGYRFYQTVSVLPSAGSQGAVYFLTSDNTLNFDTGSTFTKSISVSSPVQGDIIYYTGSAWAKLAAGTSGQLLETLGAGANPAWLTVNYASVVQPYIKASNTQSSGVNGGTATSGSWANIVLNTKDSDTTSIATLSSNQVALPAGTYQFRASQSFYRTSISQLRLQNITDASTIMTGMVCGSAPADNIVVQCGISGQFTLASTKTVAVQYQVATTGSNTGLGAASSFGSEVYAIAEFNKTL